MTDTTTPQPEPEYPFDPDVPKRVAAAVAEAKSVGATFATVRRTDLAQLLERDTYAEKTRLELAEASANWRHKYEKTRAKLEAVRAVANEWATYAYTATQDHPDAALAAGRALGELVNALDGDTDATQDGDPR